MISGKAASITLIQLEEADAISSFDDVIGDRDTSDHLPESESIAFPSVKIVPRAPALYRLSMFP